MLVEELFTLLKISVRILGHMNSQFTLGLDYIETRGNSRLVAKTKDSGIGDIYFKRNYYNTAGHSCDAKLLRAGQITWRARQPKIITCRCVFMFTCIPWKNILLLSIIKLTHECVHANIY
jgi:hypothetical protein